MDVSCSWTVTSQTLPEQDYYPKKVAATETRGKEKPIEQKGSAECDLPNTSILKVPL